MKKTLLSIVCALMMVCMMAMPAFANDGTKNMYTNKNATMYADANASSRVIQVVPNAAEVISYQKYANGFTNCFYGSDAGWILTSDLAAVRNGNNGGGQNNNLNGTYNTNMQTKESVNLRTAPTMNSRVIMAIPANSTVYVYQVTDGWAECDYAGQHGFVSTDFLSYWDAKTPANTSANEWSAVYNFADYIAFNPDVAAVYGKDPNGALNHFITFGMKERRKASKSWDLIEYMASHPELVAKYGTYYPAYYMTACGKQVK